MNEPTQPPVQVPPQSVAEPTLLPWVGPEVACNWPEGATVLVTEKDDSGSPRLDNGNLLRVTTYFRPDLVGEDYAKDSIYVLLKHP